DLKSCFLIVIARTLLSGLLFGSMASIIYSMTGGLLSLVVMYFMMRILKNEISLVSVSIAGAIFHNIGQLGVAMLVLANTRLILLMPYLLIIAIPTGLFVGVVSNYLLKYLRRSNFNFKL
ncbi:MAG: Gx transporter family protein, partial [Eubacteriaceae bacterium]|nr:Gx transporter family protein [Eubacteriaceae bacterium]